MSSITFGIITVSDTCYGDISKDASGPELKQLVTDCPIFNGTILYSDIVPDDSIFIENTLIDWSGQKPVNVILTSGGTGFSERDVTPEATRRVIDKEAPGIALAMLNHSLKVTPMAMLSRAVCGIRRKTLIINLPGSPKAAKECLSVIAPVIPHAVDLILGNEFRVSEDHKNLQDIGTSDPDSSDKYRDLAMILDDVVNRPRKSPYPMISLKRACSIIKSKVSNHGYIQPEVVTVENSYGRDVAENIYSEYNLPPFRASIKDGYAVLAEDGAGTRRVLGGIEAGQKPGSVDLRSGECVRVNTGAPIPDKATAVVPVEDTRLLSVTGKTKEETIEILVAPKLTQDIRDVGSDIKQGQTLLPERTIIGASEMGILAACGITKVRVSKLPIVGILSTGNELRAPGDSLQPGQVYDSNRIMLMAMLKESGYDSIDFDIVGDDMRAMIARIEKALSDVDVLITTGSVSMGDKDMLKPILQNVFRATIHFGRVNLKPGKPTTFATCEYHERAKFILCLPGNPVSAMVTANLFAIPLLDVLSDKHRKPVVIGAKLMEDFDLDPRPEYVRAILNWGVGDIPIAHITGNQISSKLLSCKGANALLMLPARTQEKMTMKKGERVSAMLIGCYAPDEY